MTKVSAAQVAASQPATSATVRWPRIDTTVAMMPATRKATAVFLARRVRTTASTFFQIMAAPGQPVGASWSSGGTRRCASCGARELPCTDRSRARLSDASAAASSNAVSARMTQT